MSKVVRGAGYAQISRRKSAVLRDVYHNSCPEDLNLSRYCRARGVARRRPQAPRGRSAFVDKSPIIFNVLPEPAGGIVSSLQGGSRASGIGSLPCATERSCYFRSSAGF